MSDNLVKRLREEWTPIYGGCVGTMFEAADRIERLEAALRVIVQVWDTDQPVSIAKAALARDAARKALEGKDAND